MYHQKLKGLINMFEKFEQKRYTVSYDLRRTITRSTAQRIHLSRVDSLIRVENLAFLKNCLLKYHILLDEWEFSFFVGCFSPIHMLLNLLFSWKISYQQIKV